MRHLRRTTASLAAAVAAGFMVAGIHAPAGEAALLCGGSVGSQKFLRWLDPLSYTLSPGGSFESGTSSWSRAGGAKVVAGNETFYLNGSRDARSLSLPTGGSATSPAYCISATQLDLRLLARGSGKLRVDVLGQGLLGLSVLQSQTISVSSAWAPSPVLLFTDGLQTLVSGSANIYLRVTAVGGSVQVDDVYVDPFLCK